MSSKETSPKRAIGGSPPGVPFAKNPRVWVAADAVKFMVTSIQPVKTPSDPLVELGRANVGVFWLSLPNVTFR